MTVPYAFGAATTAIPLSQLDDNFNTTITLGNTAIQLGNTVTTLNNMTLANVTISSGNVTLTNVTVTTANATTVNTTTLIATTANVTTINATDINVAANVTLNGGTANGVAYLNGSKVLTTGSALTFDGAKLNNSSGSAAGIIQSTDTAGSGNFVRILADSAFGSLINFTTGSSLRFATSADNFGSFSEQMRLTSTGLGIGITNPANKLVVSNAGANGLEVNPISGVSSGASLNGYNRSTSAFTPLTYTALAHYFQVGSSPTTAATLDTSGNLGLGVTPKAWNAAFKAFEVGTAGNGLAAFSGGTPGTILTANAYYDSVGWKYGVGGTAVNLDTSSGYFRFNIAASGTAGDPITFIQALTLDANRNLALNTTSVGTSAVGVLSVGSGTEPSSGPADTVQIYSVDRSAGNTIPAIYCEGSGVTNAGITNVTVTHKIAIKVNGTVYYLLATTVAT